MEQLSTMGEASAGYLMDETMYAPQIRYSDCYATSRFQTLGYDFQVYCEDEALGRYVDRIYGHLAVPGDAEHDYAIYGVGEGPQGPEYRLDIDGCLGSRVVFLLKVRTIGARDCDLGQVDNGRPAPGAGREAADVVLHGCCCLS